MQLHCRQHPLFWPSCHIQQPETNPKALPARVQSGLQSGLSQGTVIDHRDSAGQSRGQILGIKHLAAALAMDDASGDEAVRGQSMWTRTTSVPAFDTVRNSARAGVRMHGEAERRSRVINLPS